MNINDALLLAQQENKAIRDPNWPDHLYMYHSKGNMLWFGDGKLVNWDIAMLENTNFELTNMATYHGLETEEILTSKDNIAQTIQRELNNV